MKIHVCDICKCKQPDAKIKYKYRAKRSWDLWYECRGWEKIELCQNCLDKIVKAESENKK